MKKLYFNLIFSIFLWSSNLAPAFARRVVLVSYTPGNELVAQNLSIKMQHDWGIPTSIIGLEIAAENCREASSSPEENLLHVCLLGYPARFKVLYQDKAGLRQIFAQWPFDDLENLAIKDHNQMKDWP